MMKKKLKIIFFSTMHTDNNKLITVIITHLENTNKKNYDLQKESLQILSNTISSLKPTNNKSESAKGVPLSVKNSPWPTNIYTEPCLVCSYYGHGHKECENIIEDYKGSCLRCFGYGHMASECSLRIQRTPPFKEGFKEPSVFL